MQISQREIKYLYKMRYIQFLWLDWWWIRLLNSHQT